MSRRGSILQDYGGSFQPMPTEAQRDAAQYYQRDKELAAQMGQQKGKDAEAEKWKKLKMIDDATDPSKYQAPGLKSNAAVTQMMLKIKEDAINSNKPAEQIYLDLQGKLAPLAQGYNTYHDNLVEQDALANEAVKANPNLDLAKVKADLQNYVDNEFLITKPDGSLDFNQTRFGTKSNALTEILKPENAWKYSKGNKTLLESVKKAGDKKELFSIGSDGAQINYTTNIPDWAQIVDQKGNPITPDANGLIPKGTVPRLALKGTKQDYQEKDERGNLVTKTMTVVSQADMNKVLSNDEFEYAFESDWQKHKQFAGIDVDPANEQDLKRVYFSQWLADNGLNQPYVSSRTHLPPQPRVSVRVGSGKGDDEKGIRDVYNELQTKQSEGEKNFGTDYKGIPLNELSPTAQGIVIEYANKLTNDDLTQSDIFIRKGEKGLFEIVKSPSGRVIAPMDFTDINIKAQAGVPEKREVVEQGKKQGLKGKTFNVIDPNTGKVILLGVDQSAADKAKSKGYKIQ